MDEQAQISKMIETLQLQLRHHTVEVQRIRKAIQALLPRRSQGRPTALMHKGVPTIANMTVKLLEEFGPLHTKAIAEHLLARGYKTASMDSNFASNVYASLRAHHERFQASRGVWSLVP